MSDVPGTTYLSPDGSMYRLTRYEVPTEVRLAAAESPDLSAHEEPVYDYWSELGGAAGGIRTLPEGSIRVVIPVPERPAPGSLFVTPGGVAYRLLDYRVDLNAEPFTGKHTLPYYSVLLPRGAMTKTDALPADARLVWTPQPC